MLSEFVTQDCVSSIAVHLYLKILNIFHKREQLHLWELNRQTHMHSFQLWDINFFQSQQ